MASAAQYESTKTIQDQFVWRLLEKNQYRFDLFSFIIFHGNRYGRSWGFPLHDFSKNDVQHSFMENFADGSLHSNSQNALFSTESRFVHMQNEQNSKSRINLRLVNEIFSNMRSAFFPPKFCCWLKSIWFVTFVCDSDRVLRFTWALWTRKQFL